MSSKYSRVCAEIDMDAIAENFRIMHEAIHPETKMVAVIKQMVTVTVQCRSHR